MRKFKVYEKTTITYVYEVEAKDEVGAKWKTKRGDANHVPEYDSVSEKQYEVEEVK